MVFGWGRKRKVGSGPEGGRGDQVQSAGQAAAPQNTEIRLADVPGILSDLAGLRASQAVAGVRRLRNDTQPLIDDLIKIGNVLEKDDLSVDDIDKHLGIIVVRGKKQLIGAIKRDVAHLPDVSSLEEAQRLDAALGLILKKVGDVLGRQTKVIHIFAKKYAGQLKANLGTMSANHKEIHGILEDFESSQSAGEEILGAIREIGSLRERGEERARKIGEIAKSAAELDGRISAARESIARARSSDGYRRYKDLMDASARLAAQREGIREEIGAQFARISRPLGRYEYQAGALDKEQRGVLRGLAESPFEAFVPQNRDSIVLILDNILRGISSGSISVKDGGRTVSQIKEIRGSVDGLVRRISDNLDERRRTDADRDAARPAELASLESGLARDVAARQALDLKSETVSGEADRIRAAIPERIAAVQGMLRRHSNTAYDVSGS